ncbi:MAG: TnpV protein [Ruminococcus bromii]|nr:TnpV protein [Ruminococcus bromii]
MTDTSFEKFGGTYTQVGDYLLPDLSLPAEKDDRSIGIWGQRRLRYLKQYHKVIYYNLLTSGKLHSHLADIEEQAQQLFLRLVKELAEKEGVTEQLKSADQIAWARRMNNIRNRAAEMVNNEVIYGQL